MSPIHPHSVEWIERGRKSQSCKEFVWRWINSAADGLEIASPCNQPLFLGEAGVRGDEVTITRIGKADLIIKRHQYRRQRREAAPPAFVNDLGVGKIKASVVVCRNLVAGIKPINQLPIVNSPVSSRHPAV